MGVTITHHGCNGGCNNPVYNAHGNMGVQRTWPSTVPYEIITIVSLVTNPLFHTRWFLHYYCVTCAVHYIPVTCSFYTWSSLALHSLHWLYLSPYTATLRWPGVCSLYVWVCFCFLSFVFFLDSSYQWNCMAFVSVWLISLSIIPSMSTHIVTNSKSSFFFKCCIIFHCG